MGTSVEDLASIAGLVIFAIFAILLFGGLTYWLYRRLREHTITLVVPPAFRDVWGDKVVVNRNERPYLYWSLIGFYAAIVLGIAVSMVFPLLPEILLLFGMTK